ncbi:hypothetical protein ABPG75_009742 [Micractinium tetrahymenae]
MQPQGGAAWEHAGPPAGNLAPPAPCGPSHELAALLAQLRSHAGGEREPGLKAVSGPSASRDKRLLGAFSAYQAPSSGLETQLEAVAFWAQLHEISRGGLQNAIEAVQATHPQLAGLLVPPPPSPAAATALHLLEAAQSSRTLPPAPAQQAQQPPNGSAPPSHQQQAQQPSSNSDSSAISAAARLMASLSALHQQQQGPPQVPQPQPAHAPPPPPPQPQQHTIRVVAAPAPQRPTPSATTVVHVQQVAPPPLLTAVGLCGGGGAKSSSAGAGAFSAVPNSASGFGGSREWSADGSSASDGSQEQARKRARLDAPTPTARGSIYVPPSNGKQAQRQPDAISPDMLAQAAAALLASAINATSGTGVNGQKH